MEVTIGGLDIHSVRLYISGGGVRCAADHGVHMRDAKGIGYKIINLRFDCLVDEVREILVRRICGID